MNGKYNMHEWGINIHKRVKPKISMIGLNHLSMNGNTIYMNGKIISMNG